MESIVSLVLEYFFFIALCKFVSVFCFCFQTCKETKDASALTKAADFVKAFILGFQVEVSECMTSIVGTSK